jgi:predicted MPP superfamily phosphohydrolase
MGFFEMFDNVYCVNLKHRQDRKANILSQCAKYKLGKVEFFEAINGKEHQNNYNLLPGAFGLILSNIEILKNAKEKKYNSIIILEDDCYFNDEIKNIDEYLEKLPNNWDMFYLGGNHNIGWVGTQPPYPINDKIVRLHNTFTTHFVAIKSNMFDILLDKLSKFTAQLDVIYTEIQKNHNVYCTSQIIANQMTGYSDIENRYVDYSGMIK